MDPVVALPCGAPGDGGSAHGPGTKALVAAVEALRGCRRLVALTGAGASTESGLPDFRSPAGLYRDQRAERILSLSFFLADPEAFWDFYRTRLLAIHTARPNAAHRALARLEAAGRLQSVLTQNIDGLHRAAGSRRVRELHGNVAGLRCPSGHRRPTGEVLDALRAGAVPRCLRCGAAMRPDIVLFEEPLDRAVWAQAEADLELADGLLVVGTSLRVAPASLLPHRALQRRVPVVIVNREPTELDPLALVVRGDAGPTLTALAEALGAPLPVAAARSGSTP